MFTLSQLANINKPKFTKDKKLATLWWHAKPIAVAKHVLTTQTKGFLKRKLAAMGIPTRPRLNLTAQAKHKATMLSNRRLIMWIAMGIKKCL
ncbi:hypothetical protein NL676_011125 [Syzygium grande]|nr:hypothetical protein NL676_011125 [Syzygium grande]